MLNTSSGIVLPHLWQKPAFDDLLECLRKLRVEQPVWSLKVSRDEILKQQNEAFAAHDRREIVSFLSMIIKSNLGWIDGDEEREEIWDEASKRLSERCGRAAMGEIIRKWPFEDESCGSFSVTIREPSLTGGSLGLKTWGSSYVLAQLLPQFASGPLAHLVGPHDDTVADPIHVLELGSGTALLGLAAACIWRANVILTDIPNIIPNLTYNANLNRQTVKLRGGHVDVAPLTWGGEEDESDVRFKTMNQYTLIIAADPLYDDDHPVLLAGAIGEQLSLASDARALIMVPQRDEITTRLMTALRIQMAQQRTPLVCVEESIVAGEDDWGDEDDDDSRRVGFWWGIFRRDMAL